MIIGIIKRNPKAFTRPKSLYKMKKVMQEHLKKNPECAYCGRIHTKKHVHHVKPVSSFPESACDPNNLLTLCAKNCHLVIGHMGWWKTYNKQCKTICKISICKT